MTDDFTCLTTDPFSPIKYGALIPVLVIVVTAEGITYVASEGYTKGKGAVSRRLIAHRQRVMIRQVSPIN